MKKIAILVLAAFMLTLLPAAALAAPKPDKVQGNKWLQQQSPNAATIQNKAESKKNVKLRDFDDVDQSWARADIIKAARKGLVQGDAGKYQPNKPVTNLELIVMLVRALDKDGQLDLDKADSSKYSAELKKIPAWGQVYVAAAIEKGIILPEELKNFNPNQGCKRYQVALYISRLLDEDQNDKDDEVIDFDSISADVEDIIAILEDLGDLGEDNEGIQSDIDDLIADLNQFADDLLDADEDDLADLIRDSRTLANALSDIIADARDNDLDEDILDEMGEAAHQISAVRKALRAYRDNDKTRPSFNDEAQCPQDCQAAVRNVHRYRIMIGDADGKFSPMRVVKRDEIAVMLSRLTDQFFGDFDIRSARGVLNKVKTTTDGYIISVLDKDDASTDYNVTDDTRIIYKKAAVDADDLRDYLDYEVVLVYDSDNDISTIKIIPRISDDD